MARRREYISSTNQSPSFYFGWLLVGVMATTLYHWPGWCWSVLGALWAINAVITIWRFVTEDAVDVVDRGYRDWR